MKQASSLLTKLLIPVIAAASYFASPADVNAKNGRQHRLDDRYFLVSPEVNLSSLSNLGKHSAVVGVNLGYHFADKWDLGVAGYNSLAKQKWQLSGASVVATYNFSPSVSIGPNVGIAKITNQTGTVHENGIEGKVFNETVYLTAMAQLHVKNLVFEGGLQGGEFNLYGGFRFEAF
jgi:hypothetical protein